ncbi:MAG: lipoate--protein ligase [Bacteroidetes bacterium HGW-Bacteroidetes-1]|jgi:lipoate-protein ligase A|nr:MAG: lipoate--protein ligase [Bacteroidetes bacterium HGW-Bacteroidetes-1]
MILIDKPNSNPWFNVAAEEYIVKHVQDEIFMVWKNPDCIVIGKHQNAIAEINPDFVQRHNLPVIRRISGGGTVFHGSGNINYSFITNTKNDPNKINFRKYTQPIIDYLLLLGVEASFTGKSNLTINGSKFSGNAAHLFKNRILHHGTLLFDADLEKIRNAIAVRPDAYYSKAIVSNRSEVCNIRPFLAHDMTLDDFEDGFRQYVKKYFTIEQSRDLSAEEMDAISILARDKYQTWHWNFGYSPDYDLKRKLTIDGLQADIFVHVSKGFIVEVHSTMKENILLDQLVLTLHGAMHQKQNIFNALSSNPLLMKLNTETRNQIANQLL